MSYPAFTGALAGLLAVAMLAVIMVGWIRRVEVIGPAFGLGLCAGLLGLGSLMLLGWQRASAQRAEFMAECMQDHKRYECTALWRAGEKDDIPVVLPIPVPASR